MIGPRVRATLVLVVVFATGGLAGVAFERHRAAFPPAAPPSTPSPSSISSSISSSTVSTTSSGAGASPAELVHAATMAELERELELDEKQVEQILRLLVDRQKLIQRHWEQLRPEVHAAMQEVHREIAELLRPDQVTAYHRWLQERRRQGLPH